MEGEEGTKAAWHWEGPRQQSSCLILGSRGQAPFQAVGICQEILSCWGRQRQVQIPALPLPSRVILGK